MFVVARATKPTNACVLVSSEGTLAGTDATVRQRGDANPPPHLRSMFSSQPVRRGCGQCDAHRLCRAVR